MSTNDPQPLPLSALLLAPSSDILSCLAIAAVLVVLGLTALEAFVFAALGGFVIACFIWTERSLIHYLEAKERLLGVEVAQRQETQDTLYARSLAGLVRFDAGTLIIERATPGFIKMLRLPADTSLGGCRLEEVLGVDLLKLESVVDLIKQGDSYASQPRMEIQGADRLTTQALVSGQYFQQEHMVEAAFFVPPLQNTERMADLEAARNDSDRFRKGMFRRETRILELKEEVNALCREAGPPEPYETDQSSNDSKLRRAASLTHNLIKDREAIRS